MAVGQRILKAVKGAIIGGDPFYAFAGMTPEARAIYEQQLRIAERKRAENEEGRRKKEEEDKEEKQRKKTEKFNGEGREKITSMFVLISSLVVGIHKSSRGERDVKRWRGVRQDLDSPQSLRSFRSFASPRLFPSCICDVCVSPSATTSESGWQAIT